MFPNKMFYDQQLSDAPVVSGISYDQHFLDGKMYASYSFINISKGIEQSNKDHSLMNKIEVAVISQIIGSLKKGNFLFLPLLCHWMLFVKIYNDSNTRKIKFYMINSFFVCRVCEDQEES